MARIADIVATARGVIGHIIRFIAPGGAKSEMPNRPYLDFAGNCTVQDDGDAIRVTVPDVPAGSVTVGNVVTLPPGTMAYVLNVGTPIHAVLNFGIPRGDATTEVMELIERMQAAEIAIQDLQQAVTDLVATVAANNAAAVHIAGAETVTGAKTFEGGASVPTVATDDNSTAAASTAWVNNKLAAIAYWQRNHETTANAASGG